MKQYYVYIMANKRNGTLYTGITSNLARRIWEHKNKIVEGFTKRYGVSTLVYCETFNTADDAIEREKIIKRWKRHWKLKMIEQVNPNWTDLYNELI